MIFTTYVTICHSQVSHKITSIDIRNKKIKTYSDSITNFKNTGKIPSFLYQKNFDIEKSDIPLKTNHKPECIRRAVLLNISDEELLLNISKILVKQKDYLQIKPTNKTIPFANFSFYELILIRIEELKNDD